ncbi:glycosyltransferase family 4 protein [Thiosulfatihalobacter marinus]|uniref:glycosyltransferase family 4 protein n=1 Tax=Thiosulfatihalobacter marinus TaxID=2792481 RepID=UPI0018D83211|nr:glycosyltransferase family 1 protein [Thiosulfatihalobacter marinus]
MPGDGTKTAITTRNPPARLFELTRALSVYGRRPSGVDRVCLAYLKALCDAPEPCFGLARTRLGYVLLDQDGVAGILARLEGRIRWGAPDLVSRLLRQRGDTRRVTEAELRRHSIARAIPSRLGQMLARRLPPGIVYINVDQANFSATKLHAIKQVRNARVTLFLHDAIPLDHPEFQTPQSVQRFAGYMQAAADHGDLILTNSNASRDSLIRHFAGIGAHLPIRVAHLGVDVDFFQNGNNQAAPVVPDPYFLCLGTIEPRKNIGLLLDVWEQLAARQDPTDMPHLVICGRRGWMVEDLLARLDRSPLKGRVIHEFNDLGDGALFGLLRGARALLFPSLAEGFGLPPAEAAVLGVPVIANDLPVLREILEDYPIYADVTDSYSWEKAVLSLVWNHPPPEGRGGQTDKEYSAPSWRAHFNAVLRVT